MGERASPFLCKWKRRSKESGCGSLEEPQKIIFNLRKKNDRISKSLRTQKEKEEKEKRREKVETKKEPAREEESRP
jgi:hypothetical protein